MKRRSNTFGGGAGFDIRTPVESRRQERGGVIVDVVVPLLQLFYDDELVGEIIETPEPD